MLKNLLNYIRGNFSELFRYGLVGLSSAATYWCGSNLLNWYHSPSWLSGGFGWLASVLVSYFGHIFFTYRVKAEHIKRSWKFLILCGINLSITISLTYLIHDWLEVKYQITSAIIIIIIPLVSYFIGKFWVFKD